MLEIGAKIRQFRKQRRMTLDDLSKKSGVALATLSRIETGRMTGTLQSHIRICQTLGINLPQLYSNINVASPASPVEIKSTKRHSDVFVHNKLSSYEILTSGVLSKRMMPTMVKIDRGGSTHKEQAPQGVEKFIYILEGTAEALIADKKYILKRGDTLYFDASVAHIFKNAGAREVKYLCISSPSAL